MGKLNLWLETGECFEGQSFGAEVKRISPLGELVFNTSMTGYQEILSDPSYCDQIVVMTFPLIGQYGVNKDDFESMIPALKGFVVHEACNTPSNWRSEYSLPQLLKEFNIPGIEGIDTRLITKKIRSRGAMRAVFAAPDVTKEEVMQELKNSLPHDQISRVSNKH